MDLDALIALLSRHEGRRNRLYKDTVGKWTIGVGRNVEDIGISDSEIDFMLKNDIERVVGELNHAIPWWTTLDPVRRMVLVDMGFMGVPRLMGFKQMLGALQAGDYHTASLEMLSSKWARQVGHRADELALMMDTGQVGP